MTDSVAGHAEEPGLKILLLQYLLFAAGLISYYLLPVWAGIFHDSYGFTATQIGILLSADMTAGTLASLSARFWIHRLAWRPVLLSSIIVAILANLSCVFISTFSGLLLLRLLTGFASGTMVVFPYAVFSSAGNPDREFSIALGLQVAIGACALLSAPYLIELYADTALFITCAVVSALPLFLLNYSPERNISPESLQAHTTIFPTRLVLGALFIVILFFAALTGVWVFIERMGTTIGLELTVITRIMAVGLLFSFLGAVSPILLTRFCRRTVLVITGYGVLILAILSAGFVHHVLVFAICICLYNFAFSYIIPLQSAWIAETDATGRNAVLIPVAQGIGVSAGPIVTGIIFDWSGFVMVMVTCSVTLMLSIFLILLIGDPLREKIVS